MLTTTPDHQPKLYNIHNRFSKCLPFASTQAPGASLQGEDPDCGLGPGCCPVCNNTSSRSESTGRRSGLWTQGWVLSCLQQHKLQERVYMEKIRTVDSGLGAVLFATTQAPGVSLQGEDPDCGLRPACYPVCNNTSSRSESTWRRSGLWTQAWVLS